MKDYDDIRDMIYNDIENMTQDELLEASRQLEADPSCPSPESALKAFKRDYLTEVSSVSLYDEANEPKTPHKIKLKTLVAVAAVIAMLVTSSLVSYAAGVASTGNNGTDKSTQETAEAQGEPLKTDVEIDGWTREVYVIKPLDESVDTAQYSSNRLGNKSFLSTTDQPYLGSYHYADLYGNVLKFEKITYGDEEFNEVRERLKQKAKDLYDAKFIEDLNGFVSGIDLVELSDFQCNRAEAGDYYFEYLMGANYEIVSRDPFTQVYDKLYVNYDTNFQMETQVIMYAECYNPEKGTYQEFVTSKTAVGPFEVVYEIPEGWMLVDGKMIIQNSLIGKSYLGLNAYSSDEEDASILRQKINAALEKYYQEKVEKNEVVEKIEENQNS